MSATRTILVTGASGFTGRYFVSAAADAGYRCVALAQHATESVPGAVETVRADIRDKDALAQVIANVRPDFVVHLAAIAFVAHGDLGEMYLTNVVGTINLVDAIASSGQTPAKMLIASSANVYGNAPFLPIDEESQPAPENDYAVSKYAMELAVRLRAQRVPIVVVRPFNYTGVGQSREFLIPKIVAAFRERRRSLELGNLDVSRDFSDVRDVVRAYLGLLEAPVASGVFNICSGQSTSLRSVIGALEQATDHSVDVVTNPALVRRNEIAELYGTSRKLVDLIGEFRRFELRDTLQWMLCG